MADRIADLEVAVKAFLIAEGITTPIRLQQFGLNTPKEALLIRRDGTGPRPVDLNIDPARVVVLSRAVRPDVSFQNAKKVADLIDGFGPGKMGTVDVLNGALVDGPTRDDDDETRLPRHIMVFNIRAKSLAGG